MSQRAGDGDPAGVKQENRRREAVTDEAADVEQRVLDGWIVHPGDHLVHPRAIGALLVRAEPKLEEVNGLARLEAPDKRAGTSERLKVTLAAADASPVRVQRSKIALFGPVLVHLRDHLRVDGGMFSSSPATPDVPSISWEARKPDTHGALGSSSGGGLFSTITVPAPTVPPSRTATPT